LSNQHRAQNYNPGNTYVSLRAIGLHHMPTLVIAIPGLNSQSQDPGLRNL